MTDLSTELERLVIAGKTAYRPNDADCERVFVALQARLGTAVEFGGDLAASVLPKGAVRALTNKTIGITAAGLALVVSGITLLTSFANGVPPVAPVLEGNTGAIASTETAAQSRLSVSNLGEESPTEAAPAPSPGGDKAAPTTEPARGLRRAHDSLSEEVAILSRAETELHSGRAESALKLLSDHERKFKNGILAEERTAARIQALCALGRTSDANAQMTRLSPESLHGERARQACGSPPMGTPRQTAGRQAAGPRTNKP
jgi:hypothetical protein